MFNSLYPPLLVIPVPKEYVTLFPLHEGYYTHVLAEDQALVSYKDGWTIPLTVQQKKYIDTSPLLMVKDSGGITTDSVTSTKGYAHKFCRKDGQEPVFLHKLAMFPEQPDSQWMFIQNSVTMIWLQYGNKNQYCGESSFDMERIYYGKLLIREFDIREDIAPSFDKRADDITLNAKQFRVESHQFYNGAWCVNDYPPEKHLQEILTANNLDHYLSAVTGALEKARGSK